MTFNEIVRFVVSSTETNASFTDNPMKEKRQKYYIKGSKSFAMFIRGHLPFSGFFTTVSYDGLKPDAVLNRIVLIPFYTNRICTDRGSWPLDSQPPSIHCSMCFRHVYGAIAFRALL